MKSDEISTQEAAEILGCSVRTVHRIIERGGLHARKLDPTAKSVFKLSRAEVQRFREGTTADAKNRATTKDK